MAVSNNHKEKLEFIQEMTKNADQVQAKVLAEILSKNRDTEYLIEKVNWSDKCCLEMEEEFNSVYRQGRASDIIGPLEIRVLQAGTFEDLMDYVISRGASINQYKAPRCVTFQPIIELLDTHVVSKHFSQGKPQWSQRK